jgi:hypothetical protein
VSHVTAVDPTCEEHVRKSVDFPPTGRRLGPLAAVLMAACAGAHLVAAAGAHASGLHVLLLLGMALACLPCAVHVVLVPGPRTWLRATLVSAAGLAAHPLLGLLPAGHPGHAHAPAAAFAVTGMVLGPALTLGVSALGLWTSTRRPPLRG